MIVLECGMMVFGMSDFSCDFLPNVAALCVLFDAPVVQFQDRRFAPNFLLRAVPSRCAGFVTHVCIASYLFGKCEFESELSPRPTSPAERSYREHC